MNWKPIDYMILLFVVFIVLFMLIFIISRVINPVDVNDKRNEIVENVLITVLSIITIYVGSKLRHRND